MLSFVSYLKLAIAILKHNQNRFLKINALNEHNLLTIRRINLLYSETMAGDWCRVQELFIIMDADSAHFNAFA